MPVAATFSFRDEAGFSLSDIARVDTMVTVVDAMNFLREYGSTDDLRQRGIGAGENDARTIVDLLVDQVEFANVLVVSKVDLVTEEEARRLEAILRHLNPGARILCAANGQGAAGARPGYGAFSTTRLPRRAPAGRESSPVTTRPRRSSTACEASSIARAAHFTRRLFAFLASEWPGVLRSKGFFWLASRMNDVTSPSPSACASWGRS
jgi:G3E family GTPase